MSEQHPGSGGILFKLGLVVLSIGVCALSMLVMRQSRLQAAHEVTQTQLRIQRADEQLWKMRADIAGLANPSRIRELAGNLGPMHALINPVEASANPSVNVAIPMIEKIQPLKLPVKPEAKTAKATNAKPTDAKSTLLNTGEKPVAPAKPGSKLDTKPDPKTDRKADPKPEPKPDTKARPRPTLSPTGLASIPAPKVRELDR